MSRETTETAVAGVSTGASRGVTQQGAEQTVNVSSVSGGVDMVNDSNMVTSVSTTAGVSSTSTVSMSQAPTTGSSGGNTGSLNQLARINPANHKRRLEAIPQDAFAGWSLSLLHVQHM